MTTQRRVELSQKTYDDLMWNVECLGYARQGILGAIGQINTTIDRLHRFDEDQEFTHREVRWAINDLEKIRKQMTMAHEGSDPKKEKP